MISLTAFSDELVKIAEAGSIAVVKRLPGDPDKALSSISRRIDKAKTTVLGFPSVAVPVRAIGDLADHGFKRTRMAVPLPWERPGTASWRKGQLHAHRKGDHWVMHKDDISPAGVVSGVKHWAKEGLPAMKKRFIDRESAFVVG